MSDMTDEQLGRAWCAANGKRQAFETVPWPELYRYDDTARDEFLRQRWERLLESV